MIRGNKRVRIVSVLLVAFILLPCIMIVSEARPKPTVTLTVKNPPDVRWFVDVLGNYEGEKSVETDDKIYELLNSYEGMIPYNYGTGEYKITNNENGTYTVYLEDVSPEFRIIAVSNDGEVFVSKKINHDNYISSTVNFKSGKITIQKKSIRYFMIVVACMGFILLFEYAIYRQSMFYKAENHKKIGYAIGTSKVLAIVLAFTMFMFNYTRESIVDFALLFAVMSLISAVLKASTYKGTLYGDRRSKFQFKFGMVFGVMFFEGVMNFIILVSAFAI